MNIEHLITQYIDGDLSGEAESELHHRLAVSPEARKLFRAQIALRGLARDPRVLHQPTEKMRADLFERLHRDEGMKAAAIVHSSARAAELPPSSMVSERPAIRHASRRRRLVPVLLPFLVGVLLSGAAFWLLNDDGSQPATMAIATRPTTGMPDHPSTASVPEHAELAEPSATTSPLQHQSWSDADVASDDRGDRAAMSVPSGRLSVTKDQSVQPEKSVLAYGGGAAAVESSQGMGSSFAASRKESEMSSGEADSESNQPMSVMAMKTPSDRDGISPDLNTRTLQLQSGGGMARNVAPTVDLSSESQGSTLQSAKADMAQKTTTLAAIESEPQMMAASVPPPPASSESVAESAPDQTLVPVPVSNVEMSSKRGSLALLAGLQQNVLVGFNHSDVQPQSSVKLGAEFNGGAHQVYGMLGRSSYRQTTAVRAFQGGVTSNVEDFKNMPDSTGTERSSTSSSGQELWGGIGYRYTASLSKRWQAGAGVWSGVGTNYLRIGGELPVSYRIIDQVRVELLPSIQYVQAYGDTRTTASDIVPSRIVSTLEQLRTTTQLQEAEQVQVGIGIGISIIIP